MPLGAQDRALLADAVGKVTGLPAANRKRIKEALRSLPSLSALTGGIAIFFNPNVFVKSEDLTSRANMLSLLQVLKLELELACCQHGNAVIVDAIV